MLPVKQRWRTMEDPVQLFTPSNTERIAIEGVAIEIDVLPHLLVCRVGDAVEVVEEPGAVPIFARIENYDVEDGMFTLFARAFTRMLH